MVICFDPLIPLSTLVFLIEELVTGRDALHVSNEAETDAGGRT